MLYTIANGPMPTTAAFATVTTGTAIKTMLQFKGLVYARVVEWGWSGDGSAAATPGKVELLTTGTVFGTVTASAAADCFRVDGEAWQYGDPTSEFISVGTSATGYTCTAEGSITATNHFDLQQIASTSQYVKQFPLGARPYVKKGDALRIRNTFGTACNAYCWVTLEF